MTVMLQGCYQRMPCAYCRPSDTMMGTLSHMQLDSA